MVEGSPQSAAPRVVAHVDMDAFYASVEVLDDPSLRGRPVIVAGGLARGVVSSASYEARAFGVRSAMPSAQALRLCPDGVFVAPRMGRYVDLSTVVMRTLATFSPLVEPLSLDEAFLELTGTERLHGPPAAAARAIKQAVRDATGGLVASVGVAPNKFVAKIASDLCKPDGLLVVGASRGDVLAFLHPLPIERLWGVGPKTAAVLREAGFGSIGDIARAPEATLVARLGQALGAHLAALARGEDDRPVDPTGEAKSVGAEETYDRDLRGLAALRPHLLAQAERVAARLRAAGIVASRVRVKLKFADFTLVTREGALDEPTDDGRALHAAAVALAAKVDLGRRGVRLTGVAGTGLRRAAASGQMALFESEARRKGRRLGAAIDTIAARFGDEAVVRAAVAAAHRPEKGEGGS